MDPLYSYSMGIAGQLPQVFILHCHYVLCYNHTWLTSVQSCDTYKDPLHSSHEASGVECDQVEGSILLVYGQDCSECIV